MNALAVILLQPREIDVRNVRLVSPGCDDVVVDIEWSGISTGTERLLWAGQMPSFPGMGYPLVPGYESVGRVISAGSRASLETGQRVFVPGSAGFQDVRGLFGGAASRIVSPAKRLVPIDEAFGEQAILLALAATAHHAIANNPPELVVGHGVLGRLLARLTMAMGAAAPTVWEHQPSRRAGALGYRVIGSDEDGRRDYGRIIDASGSASILDELIARLAPRGEITLAGFYDRLSFAFPPAFMREARIRIAAEWASDDMLAVRALLASGALSLDGLITHRCTAANAAAAYQTAFSDPDCLKMVLDWRSGT